MSTMTRRSTPEEVWAAIEAVSKAQQKTEEAQQKTEVEQQKTEQALRELSNSLNRAYGDFTNKWGEFVSSLVSGNLVRLLKERDIAVDRIQQRVICYRKDGIKEYEYDLVALNGKEAVVIEAKSTLTTDHVDAFVTKLKKFKNRFPNLAHKRSIYGGVAYLGVADKSPEKYAQKKGLFVIQSPGGKTDVSVIVNKKDFRPKKF